MKGLNKILTKDVLITLISTQREGTEKSTTELITGGKYKKSHNGYMVSYEESEATGYSGATTTIEITDKSMITMTRGGNSPSQLIIELAKKHLCHYSTPFGDFMVGITAKEISSNLDENGGTVDFSYVLDINSSYVSDFELSLKIEPTAKEK